MLRTAALKVAAPRLVANAAQRAGYATFTAPVGASAATATGSSNTSSVSLPSLNNIEAAWNGLAPQEQEALYHHLEGLQAKDWKELTLDEKKAGEYRVPALQRSSPPPPGATAKLIGGIAAAIAVSGAVFAGLRSMAPEPPRTMTKEWQEASMERAREQKMDPFTGPASDHPKARTLVQSK